MGGGIRGSGRAGRSGVGWWSQSEGLVADVTSLQDLPGQDQDQDQAHGPVSQG